MREWMLLAGVSMQPKGESARSSGGEDRGFPVWVVDVSFIKHVRAGFQQDFEISKCIP